MALQTGTKAALNEISAPDAAESTEPFTVGEAVLSAAENTVAAGSVAAAAGDEAMRASGYAITGRRGCVAVEVGAETGALVFVAVPATDPEPPTDPSEGQDQ